MLAAGVARGTFRWEARHWQPRDAALAAGAAWRLDGRGSSGHARRRRTRWAPLPASWRARYCRGAVAQDVVALGGAPWRLVVAALDGTRSASLGSHNRPDGKNRRSQKTGPDKGVYVGPMANTSEVIASLLICPRGPSPIHRQIVRCCALPALFYQSATTAGHLARPPLAPLRCNRVPRAAATQTAGPPAGGDDSSQLPNTDEPPGPSKVDAALCGMLRVAALSRRARSWASQQTPRGSNALPTPAVIWALPLRASQPTPVPVHPRARAATATARRQVTLTLYTCQCRRGRRRHALVAPL